MCDLIPMRSLVKAVGQELNLGFADSALLHSTVFEDNTGTIALAIAPKIAPRTKHIAVKYHHFWSQFGRNKGIEIIRIDTNEQQADPFTKGLMIEKFQ
jgi:hypothetical protein